MSTDYIQKSSEDNLPEGLTNLAYQIIALSCVQQIIDALLPLHLNAWKEKIFSKATHVIEHLVHDKNSILSLAAMGGGD